MALNTVNISFQKELLNKIDELAQEESRTRSELVREAARMYIEKKSRWTMLFKLGDSVQNDVNITESEIIQEVKNTRSKKEQ